MQTLKELMAVLPQQGTITELLLRPEKRAIEAVREAQAAAGQGLLGDRYGKQDGRRQVTLIQAEHLEAVASLLGIEQVAAADVRRNVVVRGINLLALKDKPFRIGTALLEGTGLCHPCSRMEETFGPGGYNAMRGHGGITARVLEAGVLRVGDPVLEGWS
jgi:MOSC domain-containing protein YiiM